MILQKLHAVIVKKIKKNYKPVKLSAPNQNSSAFSQCDA